MSSFTAAAAHVAPVFLDREKTVAKACGLIAEAARHGAALIAFPETFVPAFPLWSAVAPPIANHEWFIRLAASSLRCPGPELDRIAAAARRHGVIVSLGFNEGTADSVGCIWNSNVLIGEDGAILNHHRKLVPTFWEKLTWANGDGAGLRVCESRLGRIGVLICGENTNPLARFALMAQGEEIHVSTYPPVWPTRDPKGGGNYDLAAAIRIRAGAHAFEAKAFNIVASGFFDRATRDELAILGPDAVRVLDESPRAVSMVIGPTGELVGDVLSDHEGLLYATVDTRACVEPKQFHDVVGSYNRFDVFDLTIDRTRLRPVTWRPAAEPSPEPREEESPSPDRPA
ncbi:MAG TPA: carbon-nitrogen hydrolase family protein [Candidatus Bathyarchaeia archaeon]|nr:carbon-nitrogen hydrolase family protein [Candidatus Bathyarchaeia archaeon]